jgi:hypothetical protein
MIQVSGVSDRRTREAILHASAGRVGKRMDTLLVPLELLSAVPHSAFPDKIQYIRWSKRQVSINCCHCCWTVTLKRRNRICILLDLAYNM